MGILLAWLDVYNSEHISTMIPTLMLPLLIPWRGSAPEEEMMLYSHPLTVKHQPILIIYTSRICWLKRVFSIPTSSSLMAVLLTVWWRNSQLIELHSLKTLPRAWSKWAVSSLSQVARGRSESIAEESIKH